MSDKNSVYIRFMAPIMPNTIKSLSQCLDQAKRAYPFVDFFGRRFCISWNINV